MTRLRYVLCPCIAAVALCACTPVPASSATATATKRLTGTAVVSGTPRPAASATATRATPVTPPPASSARAVGAAIADLRERLGLSASATIAELSLESQDWPDTSLGCPDPEKMYAQVITPGYLIVLASGDTEYEYHTDVGERVGALPGR